MRTRNEALLIWGDAGSNDKHNDRMKKIRSTNPFLVLDFAFHVVNGMRTQRGLLLELEIAGPDRGYALTLQVRGADLWKYTMFFDNDVC